MTKFRVPLATTLFIIGGAFAVLELVSVYALLTGEPVTFISHIEQYDNMVIEYREGLGVSGLLGHLCVLGVIACSTTAGLLVLRTSRTVRQTGITEAP